MTGRAAGGPVASAVGRGTSAVSASSAKSVPPVLPFLLLLALAVGGSPAAARVPQPAPRPQFLEEVRPVLPEAPMEPLGPPQEVVEEIPERQASEPRKRAAIVLDKLMFALQKALDDNTSAPPAGTIPSYPRPRAIAAGPMDLQRRGNGDGRLYWRCYFNAVSCF